MKPKLQTWNDDQTVLEYFEVGEARLRSWFRKGLLRRVSTVEGDLTHKNAIIDFSIRHRDLIQVAQEAQAIAEENQRVAATQLHFDY